MLPRLTTFDDATPDELRPVLQPLPAMTEAGTRLLNAASDLFYLRGVRAVGVDLIADTAGTTKKTLYDRFGSKDALVALYLLRRAHLWRQHLLARLSDAGVVIGDGPFASDPTESDMEVRSHGVGKHNNKDHHDDEGDDGPSHDDGNQREQAVLLVFDALDSWMGTERRGCAFVNAFAEVGEGDHPAVPIIRAEKAWMRSLFDTLTGDPSTGAHVHLLYEGTLVLLTAGADAQAAAEARRCVGVAMAGSIT